MQDQAMQFSMVKNDASQLQINSNRLLTNNANNLNNINQNSPNNNAG
jgi:hypothetical protein